MAAKTASKSTEVKIGTDTATFGGVTIPRFKDPQHEDFVPPREVYVDAHGYMETLAYAWQQGWDVLLMGETGVGKTSLVRAMSALCNRAYRRVPCQEATDTAALIGKPWLWVDPDTSNQEMIFQRGPVYDATMHGHVLVLDEWNLAHPDVQLALNPLFGVDEGCLIVMENEGEVVPRHEDFRLVATGNPHTYAGVKEWNAAALSRFDMVIWLEHLPPDAEKKILLDEVQGLDADVAQSMVSSATAVRDALSDEVIRFGFSLRELRRWAQASLFYGVARAAELTVVSKCEKDDMDPVRDVLKAAFNPTVWGS